jgi:hypothetical protein
MTALLLVDFILVAASAILRRDNHGDGCAIVFKGVAVRFSAR